MQYYIIYNVILASPYSDIYAYLSIYTNIDIIVNNVSKIWFRG